MADNSLPLRQLDWAVLSPRILPAWIHFRGIPPNVLTREKLEVGEEKGSTSTDIWQEARPILESMTLSHVGLSIILPSEFELAISPWVTLQDLLWASAAGF